MTDTSLFFSTRPAYPWSAYPIGLPALAVVAALLVLLTVWTYLGHPQANRRRIALVLTLRLLALLVTLLTAVRPSVGFQEEPNIPAALRLARDQGLDLDVEDASYFLHHMTLLIGARPGMAHWRTSRSSRL